MRALFLVAAVVLSAGSASSTGYHRMDDTGGYNERLISPGRYYIHVEGNADTDAGSAAVFFYRRAQELCTAAGFKSFTLEQVDKDVHWPAFKSFASMTTIATEVFGLVRCEH